MAFKFESLQIWQKAFDLSDEIHKIAICFPKVEMFSLGSQIKRAADSVVLNIAEGSTGLSNAEFGRFLNIALRSAIEVVACLMLAKKRDYINEEHYTNLYNSYDHLCKMITKFRDSLK
jgi:four helix bundle protein